MVLVMVRTRGGGGTCDWWRWVVFSACVLCCAITHVCCSMLGLHSLPFNGGPVPIGMLGWGCTAYPSVGIWSATGTNVLARSLLA